jgi:GNAT superfamily N-acetyltransferase
MVFYIMISDFPSALNIVKKVLAADFACEETDFDREGIFIRLARDVPGGRRFPLPEKFLAVVSMGTGVVISCSAGRLRWAGANFKKVSRDYVYSTRAIACMDKYVKREHQFMAGPDLKYICTHDTFQPYIANTNVEITLVEGDKLLELYKDTRFPNSLGPYPVPERPMTVAAVARCHGELAGIAAVCAESDPVWQVGVDTLPEFRQRSIGKAIVSAVTGYVLKHGIVPYYSTTVSNIASRRIALSLGYRPAWVEMYSREIQS